MIEAEKLKILTEGAKYDVSCSSSGSQRKNTLNGIGNASFGGICHSFTEDGRCVSLLKILMSNDCIFNCRYCVNRSSVDVPRATATPDEICELVMNFYKRNYIEGLFLSSAVVKTPNYTMENLVQIVKKLRTEYHFNGYIHLKGIPYADQVLIHEGAKYADRMSFNIELPTQQSLKLLAPQKSKESVLQPMHQLVTEKFALRQNKDKQRFLPAGQTTQMIVGASPETDGVILKLSESLYRKFKLKRVYYSAYLPVVQDSLLPTKGAGLLREHRLYQADWLIRYYGFSVDEIVPPQENLSESFDPKCAWALRHMELFPIEVNKAPLESLLRVPGIGLKSAQRILRARRYAVLSFEDLLRLRVVLKRAKHFITCKGKFFGTESADLPLLLASTQNGEQLSLFSNPETQISTITGEF